MRTSPGRLAWSCCASSRWARPPAVWDTLAVEASVDIAAVVRTTLLEMPTELRRVMVLRDIEGCSPGEVAQALGISDEDEQRRLHQARGLVRARLEERIEGREAT